MSVFGGWFHVLFLAGFSGSSGLDIGPRPFPRDVWVDMFLPWKGNSSLLDTFSQLVPGDASANGGSGLDLK